MAPDPRDTRVLIPRVRRAIEGPSGLGSAVAGNLSDDQVNHLVADAVSEVILYTGGFFGKSISATERDDAYGAPTAYQVSPEITLAEASLVAAQAALDFFLHTFRDLKVSEEIANEAQTWKYTLSANVVRDILTALKDQRDRAIEAIEAQGASLDVYASFLQTRDVATSLAVEPWVEGVTGAVIQDTRPGFGW